MTTTRELLKECLPFIDDTIEQSGISIAGEMEVRALGDRIRAHLAELESAEASTFNLYLDQIDADIEAIKFIETVSAKHAGPHREIQHTNLERSDGRVTSLWAKGFLVALAVVLRDDLNKSVLFCAETSSAPNPADARDAGRNEKSNEFVGFSSAPTFFHLDQQKDHWLMRVTEDRWYLCEPTKVCKTVDEFVADCKAMKEPQQ
jgi:hypothetical protein